MDITYETAPLALQILERQIEGRGNDDLGQKGFCMSLMLQRQTHEHALEMQGMDPLTNREHLALIKQEREANAILEWMMERKANLEKAIESSEAERDAAIAKALGKDAKAKRK